MEKIIFRETKIFKQNSVFFPLKTRDARKMGKKKRWQKIGTKKMSPIFLKKMGNARKKRWAKNGPSNRKRWDFLKK